MADRLAMTLFAFLAADLLASLLLNCDNPTRSQHNHNAATWHRTRPQASIIYAEAKGVAGLGKAGGDGTAGSDKAGQQVPPEVYNALSYAGSIFLLILSVPFVCFGLNKLLNKIEDCFGCGPSSKREKQGQRLTSNSAGKTSSSSSAKATHSLATDERLRRKRDEFRGPALGKRKKNLNQANNLIGHKQQQPTLQQLNGTSLLQQQHQQNQTFHLEHLQQQLQQQADQQQKLNGKNTAQLFQYDSSYEFVSSTPDNNNNNNNSNLSNGNNVNGNNGNSNNSNQQQFNANRPSGHMAPGGAIKLPFSNNNIVDA